MSDKNRDVSEIINNEIKSNDVILYMKGTPDFPMCGFSAATSQILNNLGIDITIDPKLITISKILEKVRGG